MDGSEKVNPKKSRKSSLRSSYISPTEFSNDTDEEFVPPKMKKTRVVRQSDHQASAGILEIKSMVSDLLEVNLCLPSIIATKCCSNLLGCEACVNNWYDGAQGLSKKCPHCNEARGYAFTHQFKGLDEFLVGIRQLMIGENVYQIQDNEEQ